MDLQLSADQRELQDVARRFASRRLGAGEAPTDRLWADIAELGWFGMAVPERLGGVAASNPDIAVVFEELGRVAAATCLFDMALLAPRVLACVTDPWADDLLAAIAGADARVVVVVDNGVGLPSERSTSVRLDVEERRLELSSTAVVDVAHATHLLVIGSAADGVFCAVVPMSGDAVSIAPRKGFVPRMVDVSIRGLALDPACITLVEGEARRELGEAVLSSIPVMCAYQVGSAQAVFEMSVEYSRERVQFGKPIGTFQRVQDHVIDAVNATDSARWATNHALWMAGTHRDAAMAIHVAKAVTAEAHLAACTSAHEVHAGIGADLQYGLARHTFISRSLYARLGDPAWHRREIAKRLRDDLRCRDADAPATS